MHGVIFAALREYGVQRVGEAATNELWAGGGYDLDEAYPDQEFLARFADLQRRLDEPSEELLRGFGVFTAEGPFAALYPDYYAARLGTIDFLLGIEETIHEVVRTSLPGAAPPRLQIRPLGSDGVLISYTSERKLCQLLVGLAAGVARHYGEAFVLEEIQCMHRGDTGCVFTVLPG